TGLPERIGGGKNFDYRFAWVRDAGYTIEAFLTAGAELEANAALCWLLAQLRTVGPRVCYRLNGGAVPEPERLPMPGYRGSQPVLVGNAAAAQTQHGVYGDIFETAAHFVARGHLLDPSNAEMLAHLADQCADRWRMPDAGMWELEEQRHYTMSKISCWQALDGAVELADGGQLPTTCRERWARERDRVRDWIEFEGWCDSRQAYLMHPDGPALDASLTLAVRFGFPNHDRLRSTLDAIDRELGSGPFHYRYSGMDRQEGCFLACSFWMIEARARLGQAADAAAWLDRLSAALGADAGILPEMVDPASNAFLGNLPQGLSHLAHIAALSALAAGPERRWSVP
ncbi:MAG: glycoside hydrolase family 15 protein, partial [Gluconacetobacter diazotrophicus]|nr:glycoside hydrolase family 15 protein [Gluconacetobacter diazotrophicus]